MRKRQYVEDRGENDPVKHAVLKWTLFPAMGALLLLGTIVENGGLQGSREDRLHRLLSPRSHAVLLDAARERTIALAPYPAGITRRAVMRLDTDRVLECRLHGDGHMDAIIKDALSRRTGQPWMPGVEFQVPLDALCGAVISTAIDRFGAL
jgi:hypothetical protein